MCGCDDGRHQHDGAVHVLMTWAIAVTRQACKPNWSGCSLLLQAHQTDQVVGLSRAEKVVIKIYTGLCCDLFHPWFSFLQLSMLALRWFQASCSNLIPVPHARASGSKRSGINNQLYNSNVRTRLTYIPCLQLCSSASRVDISSSSASSSPGTSTLCSSRDAAHPANKIRCVST